MLQPLHVNISMMRHYSHRSNVVNNRDAFVVQPYCLNMNWNWLL